MKPEQLLSAIQHELSGKEWTPDTTQAIADLLNNNGYPIANPDEIAQSYVIRNGVQFLGVANYRYCWTRYANALRFPTVRSAEEFVVTQAATRLREVSDLAGRRIVPVFE